MGKFLGALLLALSATVASVASAEDRPVVVELFTSQGCSSCPPADAYLHELAKNPDVIALALHVDYWDYIGWKDSFADPAFTKRQRSYARVQSERVVYTPQMMINGVEHVVGNRTRDVANVVAKHANAEPFMSLSVTQKGQKLTVIADNARAIGDFDVHLVRFVPLSTVRILRGENAGRTLSYVNVVADWQTIGRWNGRGTFNTVERVAAGGNHVVLVQRHGHREIVAAIKVN